jgi:hypothetical protein
MTTAVTAEALVLTTALALPPHRFLCRPAVLSSAAAAFALCSSAKSAEALTLGRSSSPSGSSSANRDPPLQRADGGDGHDLGSPCRGGVR